MAAFYEVVQDVHSHAKNGCLTSSNALHLLRDVTPSRVKNSNKKRISLTFLFFFSGLITGLKRMAGVTKEQKLFGGQQ
jgi:hypothetical protein